jgi:hypothetical protein
VLSIYKHNAANAVSLWQSARGIDGCDSMMENHWSHWTMFRKGNNLSLTVTNDTGEKKSWTLPNVSTDAITSVRMEVAWGSALWDNIVLLH